MDAAGQAIANAGPAPRPLWDPQLWLGDPWFVWTFLSLLAILVIGALVITGVNRWRKRSGSERLSANEQLANFRELYDKGELSQAEFERIRALLSQQLRHEFDVPAAPSGSAAGSQPEGPKPAEPGHPPASNQAPPAE